MFFSSQGLDDKIAICTIEQISPFPFDLVKEECDKYSDAVLNFVQVLTLLAALPAPH